MLFILAILGLTLGATVIQLTPEIAGEAIAMYIVEPPTDGSYGASIDDPDSALESTDLTGFSDSVRPDPIYSATLPIMLAAVSGSSIQIADPTPPANAPAQDSIAVGEIDDLQENGNIDDRDSAQATANTSLNPTNLSQQFGQEESPANSQNQLSALQLALLREKPKVNPDNSIFLPVSSQRVFGIRTRVGTIATVPVGAELPGRVVVNPASRVLVQATYRGILEKANGHFPFAGQRVTQGQLLAKLKPINNHLDEAQVRERITELTNEIELDRKRMAMMNEVVYVRYRVNKIEEIRTEIQGLIRRVKVLEDSLTQSYNLRAQTGGVISEVGAAAGQHVEQGATLFRIIDPNALWVEASGYEQGLQNSIQGASALTLSGDTIELKFVGGGLLLSNQAIPLLFEVVSTEANALSIGNPVTVFIQTGESVVNGVQVPRSSLVRGTDGSTVVWKKIAPELFRQVRVAVTPIDADMVLVSGNLLPTDRVVSSGVGLLSQIR